MDFLTVGGFIVGIAALVLGWVALVRSAPPISWVLSGPDEFTLWNEGPGAVRVRRASVTSPERVDAPISGSDLVDGDERLFAMNGPYAKGAVLPPQRRYNFILSVNASLQIDYQSVGFLGFLSRATVHIEGAM